MCDSIKIKNHLYFGAKNQFMRKKILKIVIPVVLLFLVFFVIDFVARIFLIQKLEEYQRSWWKYCFVMRSNDAHFEDTESEYRNPDVTIGTSKMPPIVLLGCSFTYGWTLEPNETFSYQLSKYTNRTVYNEGICDGSPATVLYQLNKPEFVKKLKDANPDLFIFTYMEDHNRRCFTGTPDFMDNRVVSFYKVQKNGELKRVVYNKLQLFWESTNFGKLVSFCTAQHRAKSDDFSTVSAILTEINKKLKSDFPNAKFVILVFDQSYTPRFYSLDYLEEKMNEIGEKNGIQVLYTKKMTCGKDLLEGKLRSYDNAHPSKEAWAKLIPDISKELRL